MIDVTISTDGKPQPVLDAADLTAEERQGFDYLDWQALEEGRDSASFIRHQGEVYHLADFSSDWGATKGSGLPEELAGWHQHLNVDFTTTILIRWVDDDNVIVGTAAS